MPCAVVLSCLSLLAGLRTGSPPDLCCVALSQFLCIAAVMLHLTDVHYCTVLSDTESAVRMLRIVVLMGGSWALSSRKHRTSD